MLSVTAWAENLEPFEHQDVKLVLLTVDVIFKPTVIFAAVSTTTVEVLV